VKEWREKAVNWPMEARRPGFSFLQHDPKGAGLSHRSEHSRVPVIERLDVAV
jgi:hypothetical protein